MAAKRKTTKQAARKPKRKPRTYQLDPDGGDDGCMMLAKPKRKPKKRTA